MKSNTKVRYTSSKSISLRSIVPPEVVKALELEHGDEITWQVEPVDNEFRISVVKADD